MFFKILGFANSKTAKDVMEEKNGAQVSQEELVEARQRVKRRKEESQTRSLGKTEKKQGKKIRK